jgi:hypothetical protein
MRGGQVLREDELAAHGAVELLSDMLQCADAHGRQVVLAVVQVPFALSLPACLSACLPTCLPACLCCLMCLRAVR